MKTKSSDIQQVLRFCISGVIGVSTYYATLYCLTEYFGLWYIASACIGFVLNVTVSFLLQKIWTFKNKEKEQAGGQLLRYLAMSISFLVANALLLYAMVQYLHMWYIWAQMILTVILTVTSFFITSRIFKK